VAASQVAQREKLYAFLSDVQKMVLDGETKQYTAQQQVNDQIMQQRDKLLAQFSAAKEQLLQGKANYNAMTLDRGRFMVDTRHKLLVTTMQARSDEMTARLGVRDREEKLMMWQLDTRNNLMMGLTAFMERREDTYPDLDKIAQLVTGLGDSGSTQWVST